MSLPSLPREIWHLIAKELENHPHGLKSLSLCSRELNDICLPLLFFHIKLDTKTKDPSHKLRSFIRLLFSKPSIGTHVRHLDLTGSSWPWDGGEFYLRIEEEEPINWAPGSSKNIDEKGMIKFVQRLPLPKEHIALWSDALQSNPRNLDALVAVLLVCLPSLQRIETEFADGLVYTPYIFSQMALMDSTCVLTKLKHLRLQFDQQDPNKYIYKSIVQLLRVPSLTHVFGNKWGWDEDSDSPKPDELNKCDETRLSNILHLEFRDCQLKVEQLDCLLRQCQSLQTLILHREGSPYRVRSGNMRSDSLLIALRSVKDTLRCLRLSQEMSDGPYDKVLPPMYPLDFSSFSSLTTLHLAASHLMKDFEEDDRYGYYDILEVTNGHRPLWERLPSSLERLRVMGPNTRPQIQLILDALLELIRDHRELFPNLQEVQIETRFTEIKPPYDEEDLRRHAKRQGVKFRRMDSSGYHPCGREGCRFAEPARVNWGMNREFEWGTHVYREDVRDMSGSEIDSSDDCGWE